MPDTQTVVFSAFMELTNAQIKSLPTTPIKIINAFGADKLIFITSCIYHSKIIEIYKLSDGSPITGASDIVVTYGANVSNAVPSETADLVLGQTSQDITVSNLGRLGLTGSIDTAPGNNTDVYIASDSENGLNYTAGNAGNKVSVTLSYIVIDL